MSGLRLAALLTTERERETYNQTLRKSSQTRSLQTLNLLYTHQCNNLRQNVSEVAEKCGRCVTMVTSSGPARSPLLL